MHTCADCDEIFDKIRDVKVHSYNHSYTNTDKNTNRCTNCDFDTDCVDSIEVHVGACRNKILNVVYVKKNSNKWKTWKCI